MTTSKQSVRVAYIGTGGEGYEGLYIIDNNDDEIIDELICGKNQDVYDLLKKIVKKYNVINLADWNRKLVNNKLELIKYGGELKAI